MSEYIERLMADRPRVNRARGKECTADILARRARQAAERDEAKEQDWELEIEVSQNQGLGQWEVYVGTVQLFLVGPGKGQMFPASAAYYTGRVGTDEEWSAARAAVRELNDHGLTGELGKDAVLAVLAKHQREAQAACQLA